MVMICAGWEKIWPHPPEITKRSAADLISTGLIHSYTFNNDKSSLFLNAQGAYEICNNGLYCLIICLALKKKIIILCRFYALE